MAVPTRRATDKDAIWSRAWTAATATDLANITGARHGDVAYVTDEARWYAWRDDDTWEPGGIINQKGTWLPELVGATTAGTFTYATQVGQWARIGDRIIAGVNIASSMTTVAPVGALSVRTLPFDGGTTLRAGQMVSVYSGFTLPAGYTSFATSVNGTRLDLVRSGSGVGATNCQGSELTGNFIIRCTVVYPV
jgi:hypothetical protein